LKRPGPCPAEAKGTAELIMGVDDEEYGGYCNLYVSRE
jgi:hypothetical protein